MPVWPVLVEAWQQECCGDPFAVGDEVSWSIVLEDAPGERVELDGEVGRFGGIASLRAGGLHVLVAGSAPPPGPATLSGVLREEHHDDVVGPPTAGVVRSIRVVPGMRRVPACPEAFAEGEDGVLVELEVAG